MKLLGYYIAHTFVNSIKKLFKTWVAFLLLFIVVCAVFGGIFGFVISGLVENNQSETNNSAVEERNEDEQEHDFVNKKKTEEEKVLRNQIIEVVIFMIVMIVVLFNIYNGNKSGTEIFTMADVNFLFASPKKPQSVLLFKVVLQMGAILLGSLYLCFQIPNLVLNLGLSLKSALGFMVAWIMTLLLGKLLSIMTYTLSATYVIIHKYVKPLVMGVILCLAFFYLIALQQQGDYLSAVLSLFASEKTSYIPMLGWIKGFAMSLVRGEEFGAVVYFLLLLLGYLILIAIIWKIKADFYEDALVGAAKMQERLEAASRGMGVKKRKKQKNIREEVLRGEGAAVFFGKQYVNRQRFAKGRVVTNTMLFYTVTCILLAVFALKVVHTNEIAVVGISMLILAFLRNFGNPIALETKRNFIYLVPDSPFKKIAYAVLAGSFETLLDMLPGFLIATALMKGDVWYAFAYYLLILSMDFLVSTTAVFIEMILPVSLNDMIKECFALFLKAFSLIPLLLIIIVGIVLRQVFAFILIATLFNLIMGFLFLFFSSITLHRGKN